MLARTLCAAFHDRRVFSGLFAATGGMVAFAARATMQEEAGDAVARAAVSALAAAAGAGALAPFTLFSVDLEANTTLVVAGVACTAWACCRAALGPWTRSTTPGRRRRARAARAARCKLWSRSSPCCVPGSWCGWWTVCRARRRDPAWLHASAWAIATGAMPPCSAAALRPALPSVYLAAATAYALFSVSYESLFYAAGFASLAWLVLERHVQKLAAADALAAGDPAPASAKPTANEVVFAASSEVRPPTRASRGTPRRSWR